MSADVLLSLANYRSDLDLEVNGKLIHLDVPGDRAVARRVLGHMQRRIMENDWRPYSSKADALHAWTRLGGIRLKVLQALDLI